MPDIEVSIGGRDYLVGCADGQQNQIKGLAETLDQRVQGLSQALGDIGDSRLLVITGLMLLDEMGDLQKEPTTDKPKDQGPDPTIKHQEIEQIKADLEAKIKALQAREAATAEALEAATARMIRLADQLEKR